jgi:predicted transcriptional regulator
VLEAPQHNPDWPSDITLWINGLEIGSWTCPGDYGGKRGQLTPRWWPEDQTMYGLLKIWRVDSSGSYIDGERLSDRSIEQLRLAGSNHVSVRLGVKPEARNVGGINLFGRRCGNYPQDLVMRLHYSFPEGNKPYKLK